VAGSQSFRIASANSARREPSISARLIGSRAGYSGCSPRGINASQTDLKLVRDLEPRGRHPGDGPKRKAEKFANEDDAKVFARARLAERPGVTAGTINPHSPKCFIGSAQIVDWLDK
jgi:hypothetical protein